MFPLRDTIPSRRKPYVMWAIIVANITIFIYELSLSNGELLLFIYHHGLVPARYTKGHVLLYSRFLIQYNRFDLSPFVTSIFLHGGWMHLIGNMWTLFIFGDNVEDTLGHFRFFVYYMFWGLGASTLQFLISPTSQVPVIGASGAIAGVMGAYLYFFPWSRILTFIPIFFLPFIVEIPAFIFLLIWFFIQFFSGAFSIIGLDFSGVAWWAHVGGFLAGLYMARFFSKKYFED
ncbi:rhomboid family intramembrane serine protease [Kosmotoga pacifica]|uniref:Peptidase S54 n=1 Tax=Kosmotoga pacifica TaxID=1330330 RepID=A0A0G2Z6A4_9BACT|nr:rhomboid family intramembrane serine protease [Kosmotoga pacifica]AKI97077.1 peptidase S54 [Kosmotoga pacifica]